MENKKTNRIFRGLTVCVLLCALIVVTLSPAAFAAYSDEIIAVVNVSPLNVRTGAGLSYSIAYQVHTGDVIQLTGTTKVADGYTWYQISGGDGYWIAQTGGWTLQDNTGYYDRISGFDADGESVWEHYCSNESDDWYYYLEVEIEGYYIRCDCGWWYYRTVDRYIDVSSGDEAYIFLGLDTNGDWIYDLKPGQEKKLPSRADGIMRQYQILEFFGAANLDTPTVSVVFATVDNEVLYERTFGWGVGIYIDSYGVALEDQFGNEYFFPVDYEFLLFDRSNQLYVGDQQLWYSIDKPLFGDFRHLTIVFTLEPVGEGDAPPLEWVTYTVRSLLDGVRSLLKNFFGLGFIFNAEGSPFKFLIGG